MVMSGCLVWMGSVATAMGQDRGASVQPGVIQPDTNRPGHDFRNFSPERPDPALCQQACQEDPRCRAFTYVKPGIQGRRAHCWLKDQAVAPVPDPCCASGEVARGASPPPGREPGPPTEGGWCCLHGQVHHIPEVACREEGGQFSANEEAAYHLCETTQPPHDPDRSRRDEPRHGLCCAGGKLFEAPEFECQGMNGRFFMDPVQAEAACTGGPQQPQATLQNKVQDDRVAGQTRQQRVPAGQVTAIPDFLLVDRFIELKLFDRWVKTGGPMGGLGYDVRYRSNDRRGQRIMYVTDNYSGVNISTNGGDTWFASNNGITARFGMSTDAIPVFSLTVDPNNPNIVWAGLKDVSRAYKTVDGGQNWNEVPPPPNRFPSITNERPFVFRGFTVEPGNSEVVYAAGEIPLRDMGEGHDRVAGRVYRSRDGGQSWHILWEGNSLARYVIVDPRNTDVLYVSTGIFDREAQGSQCATCSPEDKSRTNSNGCRGGVGVLKSPDGGRSWQELGFARGLTDHYVGSLVMHPTNFNTLLAGAGCNTCSEYRLGGKHHSTGGVFLTTNGGSTWTKTLFNETITSVEFAPSAPNIAYAGGRNRFHRSDDGGQTWQVVAGAKYPWGPPGALGGFPIDILVDPDDPNTLFVNNYGGGNVKSTDGGKNWTIASRGYTGALLFDVEMHPTNPDIVYASARSGVFKTTDGGKSWAGMSYPPAVFAESYSSAVDPDHPNIVLASQELGGKLYRSTNGGQSWQEVFKLPVPGGVGGMYGFKRIVFAPSTSQVVYAASCRSNNHLLNNKSAHGVFKSIKGGIAKSWVKASGGQLDNMAINDLAVHPKNHNFVWAATASDGLWWSHNSGGQWVRIGGLGPSDIRAVALSPTDPNVVYAGAYGGGVHRGVHTPGKGWQWFKMAAGIPANDDVLSIVVSSKPPYRVWAGSQRTGVHFWDDIEQEWSSFNQGLEMKTVFDLAISDDGTVLYAATHGGGAYRLKLSR